MGGPHLTFVLQRYTLRMHVFARKILYNVALGLLGKVLMFLLV